MKALAQRLAPDASKRSVSHSHLANPPVSESFSTTAQPTGTVLPQPTSACACGGGCPRCMAGAGFRMSKRGDAEEREAEAIADRLVQLGGAMSGAGKAGRAPPVAPFVDMATWAPDPIGAALETPSQPLQDPTRLMMERALGADLTAVRIHRNPIAAASARALAADAYAFGNHIVFGASEHDTESPGTRHLLAHELAHVVQQYRSGVPAVMRYEIALEGGAGHWSSASLQSIRDQLTAWGVVDPGDLATINGSQAIPNDTTMGPLSESSIRTGMTILEALRTMGGPGGAPYRERVAGTGRSRRTVVYYGRVIEAWNVRKDDLGPGRRYPTILHFVVRLEQMALASMGMSYLAAIRAMPTVRIAGLEVGVHPRAVYFTAAAQAEMDVRSGLAEGAGHYVAPGAFFIELLRIQRLARLLARPPRRRRGQTSPTAAEQQTERLGIAAFNRMRGEVRTMVDSMRRQAAQTEANEPIEHREPGLQRYLLPLAEQIEALPLAGNADEARTLAGQLDRILGTIPFRSERTHGGGSIDPHGTAHALGLAIDMFNGVSSAGVYQNFGVPAQNWPFLHLLMDRFGQSEAMRTLRPRAIHELYPRVALELASLVADHGQELADELRGRADEIGSQPAARARRATLGAFAQIRNRLLRSYTLRWQMLTRALGRSAWYRGEDDVRHLAAECQSLMTVDRRSFVNLSPDQVRRGLTERQPHLQELYERGLAATGRARSAAAERTQGEAERLEEDLARRERQADEDLQRAQEAWDARRGGLETELAEARRLHRQAEARGLVRERTRLQAQLRRARRETTAGRAGRERRHVGAERRAASTAAVAERRRSADLAVLEAVRPSAGSPSIEELASQLAGTSEFQPAFSAEREAQALHGVRAPGFTAWLTRVSNIQRPMADQPQLMVESLNAVLSHPPVSWTQTHFFGGHHWDIAPVNILTRTTEYAAALERDMRQPRRRAMIDRVLTIMAESAGGQRILSGSDPTFTEVIERVFPGESAERVRRALATVAGGAAGTSSRLADFLRARGFHYLAGDEAAPGEVGGQTPATGAQTRPEAAAR